MTMLKRVVSVLALLLTIGLVAGRPAAAQTYNTSTTVATAVTSYTNTSLAVASVTGMAVGNYVYVDHELMRITAINTTTKILTVVRSQTPSLHSASAVVFWGPGSMFVSGPVDNQGHPLSGACTASNYPYLPLIDVNTGNVYLCRAFNASGVTAAQWTWTNQQNGTLNSLLKNLS